MLILKVNTQNLPFLKRDTSVLKAFTKTNKQTQRVFFRVLGRLWATCLGGYQFITHL